MVGHCLTRTKSLLDHAHDRGHIVKSAAMGVVPSSRKLSQVEYKYLVALKLASIRLLGRIDVAETGSIIRQGSHDQEEVIVQEIDTARTDSYRTHWPFLRDRRIDSYLPITKRFIDEQ